MLRAWRRPWRGVIIALTLIFIAGIAVAAVFNAISANKDDIWSAISKAGVAIAATTVAGAVATAALKLVDEWRLRDQERRRVFHEIVEAYNEVKSIRRSLRALGLLSPRLGPLTAEEAEEVLTIMTRLNSAQLRFEAIKKEVEQSNLFNNLDLVTRELRTVEDYINKSVISKWEKSEGRIRKEADRRELDNLKLPDFVRGFELHIFASLDSLTLALHRELFGRPKSYSLVLPLLLIMLQATPDRLPMATGYSYLPYKLINLANAVGTSISRVRISTNTRG